MNKKRIIVIGGLSAGPSAAAKARRVDEHAEILLFEKDSAISYATCGMPYALSGKIPARNDLIVLQPELFQQRFNVQLHLNEPVTAINCQQKTIQTSQGTYEYDKLVFAAGATSILPPIKNLDETNNWSMLRTLDDFDRITAGGRLNHAEHVTVVGGGLIGVEVAENLRLLGKKVVLVEGATQLLPQWSASFAFFAENTLRSHGIDIKLGKFMTAVNTEGKNITGCQLQGGDEFKTDFVVISAGIRPNSALLVSQGVETIANGAIIVNERMETSLPDIYAAGDVATVHNRLTNKPDYMPLGTHSNKGGRAAGANSVGGNERFLGGYGSAIVQVFDYTLGRTGLSRKQLKEQGIDYKLTYIIAAATPGYYPNSTNMVVEIAYDRKLGRLLSAEVFGEKGVDKRIDVLSTAIYAKLTIEDLPQLDLAYAPPYSPAKDPVVVAGFVAGNHKQYSCTPLGVEQLEEHLKKRDPQTVLVDVRTASELEKDGFIEGAQNIELDHLRQSIDKLDKKKTVILYCARGLRGYLAVLILSQHGFTKVKNLAGGFTAWKLAGKKIRYQT